MPRQFSVAGVTHTMSISAIGRIEEVFGESALQIAMKVQREWLEKGDDGKMRLKANRIRLGDAYRLIAAATSSTPDEVASQVQGQNLFESAASVLIALSDEAMFLVNGKEGPGEEPSENPSPAAGDATSGG
jgi:hypothetical protein